MAKKILNGENAIFALERGADALCNSVKITLGPKGRNVVLDRAYGVPLITNDGVTIAKEIDLADPFENLGAQIIKEVCTKTNDVAGDGTTTASVLAQAIIKEGIKNFVAGANPIILRKGIEKAVFVACEKLKQISKPINDYQSISQVASISAGDEKVGILVADAMKKVGNDGIITIEESSSMTTELAFVEGMRFDRGYVSSYMCTDMNKMEAVLDNPYILVTDKKITSMQEILPVIEKIVNLGGKLLLIADDVEGEALTALVLNKVRGVFSSVCVKAPGFGDRRKQDLDDIAAVTGATMVSEDFGINIREIGLEDLGRARQVIVTQDNTTIVEGCGKQNVITERVMNVKELISKSQNEYDKEKLNERMSRLKGIVAIIKVGAVTEVEMKEKKLRIEDALSATKAAVLEGIVPGGGVALLNTISDIKKLAEQLSGDEKVGALVVSKAVVSPLKQMCENAGVDSGIVIDKIMKSNKTNFGYDVLNDTYCDMVESGIIDPTKVTRSALMNAGSVASTMLTTNCLVVEEKNNNT
ncbi:MAG: chaperonin GroEL [Clostridia bacterium]|nr:chaperonin GroEL [Clostridia bacterium]